MNSDAKTLATTYFGAWMTSDIQTLRSVLADDVTFSGSMGAADGADDCIHGMQEMAKRMDDLIIRAMVADGSDVITWYDLHVDGGEPMPTANWTHIVNGKISSIRATFDPRPMLATANR